MTRRPLPAASRGRRRILAVGLDRLHVFVPAIMSVGMAFWLATMLRDAVRWRGEEVLERRATNAGRRVALMIRDDEMSRRPEMLGLRHRPAYLVTALAAFTLGAYVFVGSVANYARVNGYVEGQGWLLAVATVVAAIALAVTVAAVVTWVQWPPRPNWVRRLLAVTPLSRLPTDRLPVGKLPDWRVSAAAMILPTAGIVLTLLVVTDWVVVEWIDETLFELFSTSELDEVRFLDPLGSTASGVILAGIVGIAALRCRPLAIAYPASVVAGLIISQGTKSIVERSRPASSPLAGLQDSFPSGHLIQATVIAGLLPLGIAALTGNRRWIWPLRIVLGLGVLGGAIHRIDDEVHWPTDVIGGVLFGLALVLAVQWIIDHEAWHVWCRACPWAPEHGHRDLQGVIHLHISVQRLVRLVAHLWAAAAVVVLTILTLTQGVPTHADGAGFGPSIQVPMQLALAGVLSLGALLSWKWDAIGAVLIAIAGAGLGIFAALEYRPATAFLLTLMFIIPAVLLWLGWQHRKTMAEILVLAVVTLLLVGGTWAGAVAVNDAFFGPTHPGSDTVEIVPDRVEWVWLGGLASDRLIVSVGVVDDDDGAQVAVEATPIDGGPAIRSPVEPLADGRAKVRLDGLEPDTQYRYHVEVDGDPDERRGTGTFRTPTDGPMSFRVVAGACARTGSNGAVFDAIASEDPLFYLALGDLHYANIDSNNARLYRDAFERVLTRPAQAALYRDVPVSYTWDDHDFGPDNSDAGASGREAARRVYREMVPHPELAAGADEAIHHAYTIGRVRFVLTDARSERTDESMLGAEQRAWLIDELTSASRTHGLVVWANSVPWIGNASPSSDAWAKWPEERELIADALAEASVDNLVMVSGDAHMVALDDGTNSDFTSDGSGTGFPVLHAAALDRPGSDKGGPYSHGSFPGGGQFGVIDIDDDGTAIEVTLSGKTWDGQTLVSETFTFD